MESQKLLRDRSRTRANLLGRLLYSEGEAEYSRRLGRSFKGYGRENVERFRRLGRDLGGGGMGEGSEEGGGSFHDHSVARLIAKLYR